MDECKQDGGPLDFKAKTVLFCSPDKRNYRDFVKLVGSTIRYLPVWTWDEIDSCRELLYNTDPLRSREAVREAFTRWGGIPRFVLEKLNDRAAQLSLNAAVAVTDSAKLEVAVGSIDSAGELSHKLLHIIVEKPYVNFHVSFGTQHIADEVTQRLATERGAALEHLLRTATNPVMADIRGTLFEGYAHRRLAQGGVFKVRELFQDSKLGAETELALPPSRLCAISKMEEIDTFQDGDYLKPSVSNFPAVDSIRLPDIWFQMTVSRSHPVKHALVRTILDHFSGNVRLYFVVPPDIFDDFKWQPIVNLGGGQPSAVPSFMNRVSQHVLRLPLGGSMARRSRKTTQARAGPFGTGRQPKVSVSTSASSSRHRYVPTATIYWK